MWRRLARALRNLGIRGRFERDLAEELRLHLEFHEAELRRQGHAATEARRLARAEFGSVASAMDGCRDARGIGRVDALIQDVRVATRRLRAAPAFTVTAVLSLAIGFGANAVVFSAINGLLLSPLPFERAEQLAWVSTVDPVRPGDREAVGSEHVNMLVGRPETFASVAVIDDASLVWERGERFQSWTGLSVTSSLSQVLKVRAVAGRLPEVDETLASPSMAISEERWRRDFGADPGVIGRRLDFADRKSFTIVAVLPAGLEFPYARAPLAGTGSGFRPGVQDFWILNHVRAADWPGGIVIGRAADDQSLDRVAASVAAVPVRQDGRSRALSVMPLREQVLGPLHDALPLLQGFALLVLVAACGNLSALILARATASRAESAVRLALGAGLTHLTRLAAVEALLICALGAGLGFVVALAGPSLLVGLAGTQPLVHRIAPGVATLGVLLGLCVAATTFFSWLPGRIQSTLPVITLLRDSGRAAMPAAARWLRPLVAAQFALSLVLLASAALLQTSLSRLIHVDSGYEPDRVLTADVLLYVPKAQEPLRRIYDRVRTLPGVEALGVVHSTPLTAKWSIQDTIDVIDGGERRATKPMIGGLVAFDYFQVMGIDLVAGRYFTEAEAFEADPRAVILNDLAARAYFPDGNAVGGRLFMYGAVREVVGVVRATREIRLDAAPEPQFYQPMFFGSSQIVLKVAGDPGRYVESVRRALLEADSRLIVGDVTPLGAIVSDHVSERRLAARLVSVFAGLAVVLAGVGLGGVLHFSTSRRWREFGVRAALGATRQALLWHVARDAVRLISSGLTFGIPLALLAVWFLRPFLFGGPELDWRIAIGVASMFCLIVGFACLVPAWRASRVDPLEALRR
jgi:predicted permease